MPSSLSVVPITGKVCKPFLLEVMVFSPESGFKFRVLVERACSPQADPIWKLVFDLFKVANGAEVQIVHVSFTSGTPVEKTAIETMADEGITVPQADVLVNKVFPLTKELEGVKKPTKKQKKALHDAMSEAVTSLEV